MSRIGKTPIEITSGVEVVVTADSVEVKGPKGTLAQSIPEGIEVQKKMRISSSNEITICVKQKHCMDLLDP